MQSDDMIEKADDIVLYSSSKTAQALAKILLPFHNEKNKNAKELYLYELICLLWHNVNLGGLGVNLSDTNRLEKIKEHGELNIPFDAAIPAWINLAKEPWLCALVAKDQEDYRPIIFYKNELDDSLWIFWKRHFSYYSVIKNYISGISKNPIKNEISVSKVEAVLSKIEKDCGGIILDSEQKNAVIKAASVNFFLITGGPGTGKTTLLAIILRFLSGSVSISSEEILLCAPTGRAARRMSESLRAQYKGISKPCEQDKLLIEIDGVTLHFALGIGKAWNEKNKNQLLDYKIVIVDEISMIDAGLMAHLLQSLAPETKLILLGDSHQLPSVKEGAVIQWLMESVPTQNKLTLIKSHRFTGHFGALAKKINAGDKSVLNEFKLISLNHESVLLHQIDEINSSPKNTENVPILRCAYNDQQELNFLLSVWLKVAFENSGYGKILKNTQLNAKNYLENLQNLLSILQEFQIMCLVNQGYYGIDSINETCSRLVTSLLPFSPIREEAFFEGMPVMLTKNLREQKIYNGDIGIILQDNHDLVAAFWVQGEGITLLRKNNFSMLKKAFAITVHKSQGSEYSHVAVVFPPQKSRLAIREIVYTGITRAKKTAWLLASEAILRRSLENNLSRTLGPSI